MSTRSAGYRIVLHPFGSLGDIHPFMAIALGLKERGHNSIIATPASLRQKIEAEGLEFRPVRPDPLGSGEAAEMVRHPSSGSSSKTHPMHSRQTRSAARSVPKMASPPRAKP